MNQNIVDYYQKVREDESLRTVYATCEDLDQVMETAVEEGRKLGFSFTKDEAMTVGLDLEALRGATSNDDELNDFELELVAAGFPVATSNSPNSITS